MTVPFDAVAFVKKHGLVPGLAIIGLNRESSN
jgi:hypothetical protein